MNFPTKERDDLSYKPTSSEVAACCALLREETTLDYALITGSSSGIGRELARVFAEHGHHLVLIARRGDRLQDLAGELRRKHGVEIRCFDSDLTATGTVEQIAAALEKAGIAIDCLVNNAGIGHAGPFSQQSLDTDLQVLELNVRVPVELCRRLLPGMLERGKGRILNVASTGAFQPGPRLALYYASKAFLLSFSEALSRELRDSGVTVTALCPGSTQSEFHVRAGMSHFRTIFKRKLPTSAEVARYGYQALMQGRPVAIHGGLNRILVFSTRFLPRSWVREAIHWLQQPAGDEG